MKNFCFLKLFCSLVKNGFYTLLVTRVFSNFPQLKQLNKIKNLREYCDLLLELEIRDSYKKLYCDYISFHFLRLCFRVLQFLQDHSFVINLHNVCFSNKIYGVMMYAVLGLFTHGV